MNGLTTATDNLSAANLTAADRIQATRDKIEAQKEAALAMESAISGVVLPTLAELIALQDEEVRQAEINTGILSQIALDRALAAKKAGETARAEWAATSASAAAALEVIAAAAEETAARTQAATDRMTSSWDRFIVNQDVTVAAMADHGLDFADIIEGMAMAQGIGTLEMAEQMKAMGVAFGDTMALIEAVGREKVDSVVSDLSRIGASATAALRAIEAVSFGQAAMATGASAAVLGAAFGQRFGDPSKAGTTDYFEGKYANIIDGAERHRLRILDEQGTAARLAQKHLPPGATNVMRRGLSDMLPTLTTPHGPELVPISRPEDRLPCDGNLRPRHDDHLRRPCLRCGRLRRGGQQGAAPLPAGGELDGQRNSCPDGVLHCKQRNRMGRQCQPGVYICSLNGRANPHQRVPN